MTANATSDTLGLRLMYSAAVSMVGVEKGISRINSDPFLKDWDTFLGIFGRYKDVANARNAIEIIRDVYGRNRPILVLVDELAKVKEIGGSEKVLSSLCELYDEDSRLDMIVSSLSLPYVAALLTNSQRRVEYVILPTLIDSDVGRNETVVWADTLWANAIKKNPSLNEYIHRILRSTHLFMSGHPRSLEQLVKAYHSAIFKSLPDVVNKNSVIDVLLKVAEICSKVGAVPALGEPDKIASILELVLSKEAFTSSSTTLELRNFLEHGDIFMSPSKEPADYFATIPLSIFIKYIRKCERSEL
jgi:hypothetical protein